MMKLSDDFIQELRDKNDISDVISGYVSIKRKGRDMVGLCPFHSEKTASFVVHPNQGYFYCFGCGAGGDVITFIRLIENLGYVESIMYLAKRVGMAVPNMERDDDTYKKKILICEINRETAKFYHNCLCKNFYRSAMKYLLDRGLNLSTIKRFGIGYAPPKGYLLLNHLKNKGYKVEDLLLANIISQGRNGEYDRFRDRIMFPIIDLRGNVIAFGGRVIGSGEPKYLNSSDTIVFRKSNNLFALNFAKNSKDNKIILAEGYMDVVSLHQAGFTNAVATLGTSLTEGQVKLLSRYSEEVVVAYDSDKAGEKASDRAIKMLRDSGVIARVLTVPKGKDPDEFIKSYGEEGKFRFKELVENSLNDIEYKLQRKRAEYDLDKPSDKVKYLNKCVEVLAENSSLIECQIYAGKLSEEIGIDKKIVLSQIEILKKKNAKKRSTKIFREIQKSISGDGDKINPDKHISLKASSAEEALISSIINNQDMVNNISLKVTEEMFINDLNKRIYIAVKQLASQGRPIDVTSISAMGFSIGETGYITKIICSYVPSKDVEKDLDEYLSIMRRENEANKIKYIGDIDEMEVKKYIDELKNIKK